MEAQVVLGLAKKSFLPVSHCDVILGCHQAQATQNTKAHPTQEL
jgi:hypothetical protein